MSEREAFCGWGRTKIQVGWIGSLPGEFKLGGDCWRPRLTRSEEGPNAGLVSDLKAGQGIE